MPIFDVTSVVAILFLVLLEGILSLDNALALSVMVRHLPRDQQRKVLTWGIWGAFGFRFLALFFLNSIMHLRWVKMLGAIYLLCVAFKGIISEEPEIKVLSPSSRLGFWSNVLLVELVDLAFSVDSMLASISISKNYLIVVMGGILGIIMMRLAASFFIIMMHNFPRMASISYYLIFIIAVKLLLEGLPLRGVDFHSSHDPLAWIFWFSLAGCFFYGFKPIRKHAAD